MNVEIKGLVHSYSEIVTNKQGLYPKKKLVILEENGQYPEYHTIEISEKLFDKFDSISAGMVISVSCNMGGRLWTNPEGEEIGFNSVRGWRFEQIKSNDTLIPEHQTAESEVDNLPF